MAKAAQSELLPATEIARMVPLQHASNGIHYASCGETQLPAEDLDRIVLAVPQAIASALHRKAYYFVPLVIGEPSDCETRQEDSPEILIAIEVTPEWSDHAVCHRVVRCNGYDCVFISTRLMQDRFALAFEFFINAGHHFVDSAGVPESFADLVWAQALSDVRGETSQDAWEQRAKARGKYGESSEQSGAQGPASRSAGNNRGAGRRGGIQLTQSAPPVAVHAVDEKARMEYMEAAFADAIAIYLLSLTIDFDYTELREREYPLLAAPALAERLNHIARLFPANAGQEFSIRYRRRNR